MSLSTKPYKGARDFYPEDKRLQTYIFKTIRRVVESFGYQEYDAPILEPLEIYLAKTGEEIINEQLYSFEDKGGRKVAIRPEMTPSVSRMVAARRQELAYPLRWYSIPNLWRYERPQRGRLREHWQLNVDLFGVAGIEGDHEIIHVADAILKEFGAPAGSYEFRISSRKLLEDFLQSLNLSDEEKITVIKVIDKYKKVNPDEWTKLFNEKLGEQKATQLIEKIKAVTSVKDIANLPQDLKDHTSVKKLEQLFSLLKTTGIKASVFDFSVVRGMDYYDDIIFEVFDTDPENTRSMFGGGRYDGLVGLFGVEPVPTVGFGMGDVTLQNFLVSHNLVPALDTNVDATVILIGDTYHDAQKLLAALRKTGLNIAVDSGQRKLDTQIKNAVKSGIKYAIFVGEAELGSGRLKLRDLEKGKEQELEVDQIVDALKSQKRT